MGGSGAGEIDRPATTLVDSRAFVMLNDLAYISSRSIMTLPPEQIRSHRNEQDQKNYFAINDLAKTQGPSFTKASGRANRAGIATHPPVTLDRRTWLSSVPSSAPWPAPNEQREHRRLRAWKQEAAPILSHRT